MDALEIFTALGTPGGRADPYPYYARLRRIDPVHWAGRPGRWVLTRYADIVSVLRSPHASADRTEITQRQVPAEFQDLVNRYYKSLAEKSR